MPLNIFHIKFCVVFFFSVESIESIAKYRVSQEIIPRIQVEIPKLNKQAEINILIGNWQFLETFCLKSTIKRKEILIILLSG